MAAKLGLNGKLYRNEGSYESPDWTEVTNVRDLTLELSKGEADVTTRANNGWRATLGTLKEGSIEFAMVWDTDDEGFSAFQDAFFDDSVLELAIMDGDIETAGSEGLRASFAVIKFSREENLENAMMANVSIKPTYATNAPAWLVIAAS